MHTTGYYGLARTSMVVAGRHVERNDTWQAATRGRQRHVAGQARSVRTDSNSGNGVGTGRAGGPISDGRVRTLASWVPAMDINQSRLS